MQRPPIQHSILAFSLFFVACSAAGAADPPSPPAPAPLPSAVDASRSNQAWLGLWLSDAVDGGVEVIALVPRGPAQAGGIRVGDVIVEIDGKVVPNENGLGRVLARSAPGDAVKALVVRSGGQVETVVRLGAKRAPAAPKPLLAPSPPRAPADPAALGLRFSRSLETFGATIAEMTPALRRHYGGDARAGVLVTRIDPQRPAGLLGMKVGDMLVRVGDNEVRDRSSLRAALLVVNPREPLRARVVRDGAGQDLSLEPAESAAQAGLAHARGFSVEGARRRRLESELERLERRVEELKRELQRLDSEQR
ncbi:MAG: PDZ domain-containing protein [bacterium]|nr:PDZ domain-containing protein [bacterium]